MIVDKKKAFTLIEMLVVIVIIGILLALVFSSANSFLNKRDMKKYRIHEDVVESATKLYVDQYIGQLSNSDSTCFNIDYNTLLSDRLVNEGDIKCSGNIIVSKEENDNFSSNYYLSCVNEKGNSVKVSDKLPSGCKGFNGKFKMEYAIYEDSNKQKVYDGVNYTKDAYVYFTSTSPYQAPISRFEYTTTLDGNWTKIDANVNFGKLSALKDFAGTVYVRSVDTDNNVSSSIEIPVKMDNTGPSFDTSVSGTWLTKTIFISNVSDKGVKTLDSKAYSFDGGTTWVSDMQKSYEVEGTVNVCSRDVLGNKTCKNVTVSGIDRVVPPKPTFTASDKIGSGSWHKNDFTLTVSGGSNVSGNIYYYGETKADVEAKKNVGTSIPVTTSNTKSKVYYAMICSVAGLCGEIGSYEVKLDKTSPPPPTITASDNKASNTWHFNNFTLNYSGASNISGNTYYYGTTSSPATAGSSTSISSNTSGTTYYVKVCSGAGLCSSNSSYTVKLDTATPTITAKASSNYITTSTGASITSYFNISYGISGGTTTCKVGSTTVTNTNNLSLGVNTVTCTATGTNGKTASASTVFRHQYSAVYACSGGRTLSGSNCTYYYSNVSGHCGCSYYNQACNGWEQVCTAYNQKCTAYNQKCTAYNQSCSGGYYQRPTLSGYICSDCLASGESTCTQKGGGTESFSTIIGCGWVEKTCTNTTCKTWADDYSSCKTWADDYSSCKTWADGDCNSWYNTSCNTWGSCSEIENSYRYYTCNKVGNTGTTGTLSGSTCSF